MKIKAFRRRVAELSSIKNAILNYLICNPLVDHLLLIWYVIPLSGFNNFNYQSLSWFSHRTISIFYIWYHICWQISNLLNLLNKCKYVSSNLIYPSASLFLEELHVTKPKIYQMTIRNEVFLKVRITKFPVHLNWGPLTLWYNRLGVFDWNVTPNVEFHSISKIKLMVISYCFARPCKTLSKNF